MGEFESGKWIIGITIYFFIFFLLVSSTVNAKIAIAGNDDLRVTYNDPGFLNKTWSDNGGVCTGKGDAVNFLNNIWCNRLDIEEWDKLTCDSVEGCSWNNASDFFGYFAKPPICEGLVNKTFYDINTVGKGYCDSPGLQNETICELFKCSWMNSQEIAQSQISIDSRSSVTIWESIKYVALFRPELGLGKATFIISFIFFWIPTIMLLFAIYMALPFLH